jgi:hypothetical protein
MYYPVLYVPILVLQLKPLAASSTPVSLSPKKVLLNMPWVGYKMLDKKF